MGESKWVTGEEARLEVHRLRDTTDAILVGSRTVMLDNPRLTTRLPDGGKDPIRVVLDSGEYLDGDREVFRVKPGVPGERVMAAVKNVRGIRPGPEGSILFWLGDNDAGYIDGLWYPEEDAYIPLRASDIRDTLPTVNFGALHFSEKTGFFYLVGREGVFTFPGDGLLGRRKERLAARAAP